MSLWSELKRLRFNVFYSFPKNVLYKLPLLYLTNVNLLTSGDREIKHTQRSSKRWTCLDLESWTWYEIHFTFELFCRGLPLLCGQHVAIPRTMFAKQVLLTNKSRQDTLSGVWYAQPGCLPTGRRTGWLKIKLSIKTDLCPGTWLVRCFHQGRSHRSNV